MTVKSRFKDWISGVEPAEVEETPPEPPRGQAYLDQALLYLAEGERPWTIRHACEGTHIFGGPGSGKTSGSGATIARAFLDAGFGGLVMTAKADERELWEEYARQTGREQDLIIFKPENDYTFNFLDYELKRPGAGGGFTQNLVALFTNVLEVAQGASNAAKEEPTWRNGLNTLLRRTIDLCSLTSPTVSLTTLYDIIRSGPQELADLDDPNWKARSTCWAYLVAGEKQEKDEAQEQDFRQTYNYWTQDFPKTPEKMRGSYVTMFTNMADAFLTTPIRQMFCETNDPVTPEMTHEGKIIILDLPVEEFAEVGQFCQALFKYVWQKATARRVADPDSRACFLWADEAQYFITENDMMFLSTARSKKACTVFLTQNLSAYYVRLGEGAGKAQTDAMLANFQTHIYHANTDHVTNTYAADTIAKDVQMRRNFGGGVGEKDAHANAGESEMVEYVILPIEFTMLRKGGPDNDNNVDAIIMLGGRIWESTGHTYLKTAFPQSFS